MNIQQSRHIDSETPERQAVTWLLFFLLSSVAILGWIAWQRLPDIGYMITDGMAATGWNALRLGWPVWALAGAVSALLSAVIVGLVVKNARERDAKLRVKQAELQIEEANRIADSATRDAEAALKKKSDDAENMRQQAREEIAAAKAAREAANAEVEHSRKRIAELEREIAKLTHDLGRYEARLEGARTAMQRGVAETASLRAELAEARGEVLL